MIRKCVLVMAINVSTASVLPAEGGRELHQDREGEVSASAVGQTRASTELSRQPSVQLAPVAGYADEGTYQQELAARVAKLVSLGEESTEEAAKIQLLLAAANSLIGQMLEPACTSRLLHIPDMPGITTDDQIQSILDQAHTLLGRVEDILEQSSSDDDGAGERASEWRQRLETLQAFEVALRAYLVQGDAADAAPETRRAASALSPLLESKNVAVAKAAVLWQAVLRSGEDDGAPALSVLDWALADPPEHSQPYSLFARLVRCRLIAARGGSAAAIGLLLQVEERCRQWFDNETDRDAAIRSTQLVRFQVLRSWRAALVAADRPAESQWCADQMAILMTERFPESGATISRLLPAVPIIVHPP